MDTVCEVCGNNSPSDAVICRYCGARKHDEVNLNNHSPVYRIVNIEQGRPVVADAINKLTREVESVSREKKAVLTVIHGYGSSGMGGAIRQECRKILEYWREKGRIKDFIIGEKFTRKEGATRSLLRRFPELLSSENLNKNNRGITLVVVR